MLTKLHEPKFQIGDHVKLANGMIEGHFILSGITKGAGEEYYYSHDDINAGWVNENQLDFYLTPEETVAVEEIERYLWQINELTEKLGESALRLEDIRGNIPRRLQEEMDATARTVNRRFRI